jgi:hypothetical protein
VAAWHAGWAGTRWEGGKQPRCTPPNRTGPTTTGGQGRTSFHAPRTRREARVTALKELTFQGDAVRSLPCGNMESGCSDCDAHLASLARSGLLVLTMSPTSFYGAEALAEDRSSHRDALLHRVVSDPHRQQDAAPSNNWPTCCSARAKTPELARAHEALAQVSTLSMCARDMRRPAGTPGGRGQDGPRAGTRAEAPRTSAVVFAFSASTQSRSPLSRGGHRRAWATKGPTTFLVPAQAYRRRTRAPRRHPRALRCPRRRPPPRADIGGRRGSPFVVGFGRRELVLLPSSTGSETSMTSGSSTRGEADASRCRGARSVGSPVLSWGGRPGRPRGRVRCAPSRAPEPTGPGRRTLRGRTGAATSPRRRTARGAAPTPLRPTRASSRPPGACHKRR